MVWITSLIIVVLLSVAVIAILRRRPSAKTTSIRASAKTKNASSAAVLPLNDPRYWGMEIEIPSTVASCESARGLLGKGFPKAEAPVLPLPECTLRSACQCRYKYMKERRSGKDRRAGADRRDSIRMESDRRSGTDRRRNVGVWRDIDSI